MSIKLETCDANPTDEFVKSNQKIFPRYREPISVKPISVKRVPEPGQTHQTPTAKLDLMYSAGRNHRSSRTRHPPAWLKDYEAGVLVDAEAAITTCDVTAEPASSPAAHHFCQPAQDADSEESMPEMVEGSKHLRRSVNTDAPDNTSAPAAASHLSPIKIGVSQVQSLKCQSRIPLLENSNPDSSSRRTNAWNDEVRENSYGTQSYKCILCGTSCASKNRLIWHIKTNHDIDPQNECPFCKMTFSGEKKLLLHLRKHAHGHKCPECGSSFTEKCSLNRHMKIHARTKPFKCSICSEAFASKFILNMHINTHYGGKRHRCTKCGKMFSRKYFLELHDRTHTGQKPYKCEYCGKSFRDPRSIKSHVRTHTGERPYHCVLCDKSFSNIAYLDIHKKIHAGIKPYKCATCHKSFCLKSNLVSHCRTHTGERPYRCNICYKAFAQNSTCQRHVMIAHSKAKQYICSLCDQSFKKKRSLTEHYKVHSIKKTDPQSKGFTFNLK